MSTTERRREAGGPIATDVDRSDLDLLLLIRHFEQAVLDLFSAGEVNGTTHTCIGQEHVPVALRTLLHPEDFLFSNHRGHGHYLARFGDPAGLLAEILGRAGAVCHGVGGSQHIHRAGFLTTGVQGESVPVAAGVALHLKRHRPGALSVAFIGDGTWGEGAVYEALNMAALWRLPLLLVVEHNGIAQSSPTEAQLAGSIGGRAAAFGLTHRRVDSPDVGRIRELVRGDLERVRSHGVPGVLEFSVPRLGPHSKGDDTRAPEELRSLRRRDWYRHYQRSFPDLFAETEERQRKAVADVVREVRGRPLSTWGTDGWG
ncbi:thiamine pyrophosphate-dependent dehydrogenase E1 component subunit alpha [Amycolatopsis anabasis]|uniref:thiamine pyrophosphate-dependent dehydrogenase E1 component subunit alpha n=1 Tax=Amycolatopsis anabasis TaxID=1840409 RepID=UPI00131B239C|nr:thiamine pyrophosphate-dependent dehydrogenase E1 component subunit alpha [Amycolatopsis anabasis]